MALQHSAISRREFLTKSMLSSAAFAFAGSTSLWTDLAEAQALVPGKERLIVRSLRFYDLETPANLFDSWITPVHLFFVRNHMSEPTTFDADAYRLRIFGEVEHPLELSLGDLRKLETAAVTNTLECAGNGRSNYQPHVPGIQWQRGAVGTARFNGPRMKDVLNRAGVKDTGKHVVFKGLDEPPGRVPPFVRSIPIEKALDSDTLLAMQMNGASLLKHHGYPVRALVPGWIGAASCKWLAEIQVVDHEFDGNFMKPGYRLPNRPITPGGEVNVTDTTAITRLNVKSIFTRPSDGRKIKLGSAVHLSGAAWAGDADVSKVEISADQGQTWQPAQLGREHAKYAWRFWEATWKPTRPDAYILIVRASDSMGRVQPEKAPWNPSGYLWNGYDQIKFYAEA